MKINKAFYGGAILLMALCATSCNNKKFQVNGTISEAKDSILYLENMSLNGPQVVDSVKLGEDGSFAFSEKSIADNPEFYRLRIANQIINVSIDSTETVTFKAAYPTMAMNYEVSGSDNCAKIKELTLLQQGLQARLNAIAKDINLGVDAVENSINQELTAYKDNVKRNYIFKEPMKAYSYFALFQTVALGMQQALIFNPRSNEADIKVYAAVATSWDTYYPNAERGKNLHNIAIEGMKDMRIVKARQQERYIDAEKVQSAGIIDIALPDNKGNVRKLSSLRGKVVLLDFHLFAANHSMERIMMLRDLYNKYHAQGLEIYQVSVDPNEHFWKTQTAALPWVNVRDENGSDSQLMRTYNILQIPTYFLIDRNNTLVKRDAQVKDIDADIKALLAR